MNTVMIDVPADLLTLLEHSSLRSYPEPDRVKIVLAVHLFQEGVISAGKAAELTGESRHSFELLLRGMGIPVAYYGLQEYQQDLDGFSTAKQSTAPD